MDTATRTPTEVRRSVLLVEDDPAQAVLTTVMLEGFATDVTCAATLAEACAVLAFRDVDCVLLDLNLPDAVGDQGVARLRRQFPGLPIVVLSGRPALDLMRLGLEVGAEVALTKNLVDPDLLRTGIDAAIGRHSGERQQRHHSRLAALVDVSARPVPLTERIEEALVTAARSLGLERGVVARRLPDGTAVVHLAAGAGAPVVGDPVDVGATSRLSAPLLIAGQRWGDLGLDADVPAVQRFGRLDTGFVQTLAMVVAGWLEEAMDRRALEDARQRFHMAFEGAPIGMLLVGLDGRVQQANATFVQMQGSTPPGLNGARLLDLVHDADREAVRAVLDDLHRGRRGHAQVECRLVDHGRRWWAQVHASTVPDADGRPAYLVVQVEDITARHTAQERLHHQALHDALTGLPNRVLLHQRLDHDLALSRREPATTAVLFCDLDRFKVINDSLGHAAGDELLRVVAARLQECVRPHDTVARLGGDEFVVVCSRIGDAQDVDVVIRRIVAAVSAPVRIAGQAVEVGISIGVALDEDGSASSEDLLRDADTAMYGIKGRDDAAMVFTEGLREAAVRRLSTEQALRAAIATTEDPFATPELDVHYQPLHSTADGRARAVEALARWTHPVDGPVSPATFIPVAEETGLIIPLGRWVLGRAVQDWASVPDVVVNVNVTVGEISVPGYPQVVADLLAEHHMSPDRLCLELTESTVLLTESAAMQALRELGAMGVRLAIDDFGTGCTSLVHLVGSPFTDVKIDRSFVAAEEAQAWEVVRAVVGLCDSLGLRTTAEGVDDVQRLQALRDIGCSTTQGYLHARPVPLEQARPLLAAA